MGKRLKVSFLTLGILVIADIAVAYVLSMLEARDQGRALVRYFDYGRSVPGKIEKMAEASDKPDSLYNLAWRDELIASSTENFAAEVKHGDWKKPVVRSYGMSFINQILDAAAEIDASLVLDKHAGPAAPPNFTFAVFQDDRANRRKGDIAVLGILSYSVPAMTSLSNRTWLFEQPAPFTYPVYKTHTGSLTRIDPLVESLNDQINTYTDKQFSKSWRQQLRKEDRFYAAATFDFSQLDVSPFARLVRRYLANYHLGKVRGGLVNDRGAEPASELKTILRLMIAEFAETARSDGQTPVVIFVETKGGGLGLGESLSAEAAIAGALVLDTSTIHAPTDPSGYIADGHFTSEITRQLGAAFLDLLADGKNTQRGE